MTKHREIIHSDGRRAWPGIVQYRVSRFNGAEFSSFVADLPPTSRDMTYLAVVHDLPAYDWLRQHGKLEIGHRLPPSVSAGIIDNRKTA